VGGLQRPGRLTSRRGLIHALATLGLGRNGNGSVHVGELTVIPVITSPAGLGTASGFNSGVVERVLGNPEE
jgi:hypothetical protein